MSRTITIATFAALAAAVAGCAGNAPVDPNATQAAAAPLAGTTMGCNAAAVQQTVLQRINEARRAGICGDARMGAAKPLTWQPALASTASERAAEIAQRGSFGRVAEVTPRLREDGYAATSARETQVAGDFSSDGAAQALLGQQKQCTALLDPAYTDIGAGCVTKPGSEFRHYWTVVVAKGTPTQAMGAGAAKKGAAAKKAAAVKKAATKPHPKASARKASVKKAKKVTAPRATTKPSTKARTAAVK